MPIIEAATLVVSQIPGVKNILDKVKGIFGSLRPACWGAMAYDKARLEWANSQLQAWQNQVDADWKNMNLLTSISKEIFYHVFGMWRDMNVLSNACSRENCQKNIDMFVDYHSSLNTYADANKTNYTFQHPKWGAITDGFYFVYTRVKPEYIDMLTPPVITTTPSTPPVTTTPTTTPSTPPYTPPVTTTPSTPPTTTTPSTPPVTTTPTTQTPTNNTSVGLTRNDVDNGDGTKTIYWYNADGSLNRQQTVKIVTSTTSGFNPKGGGIDIGGQVGDWTFGASNNKNQQTTMMMLGGAGLVALIMFMNKKK